MTAKLIKLSSVKADLKSENEGQWIESTTWPGASFLVRSPEYAPYQNDFNKGAREYSAKRAKNEDVSADAVTMNSNRLVGKHLVLGWKGFDEQFDPSSIEDMLSQLEWRDLARAIFECAMRVGKHDVEFVETQAGN